MLNAIAVASRAILARTVHDSELSYALRPLVMHEPPLLNSQLSEPETTVHNTPKDGLCGGGGCTGCGGGGDNGGSGNIGDGGGLGTGGGGGGELA